MELRTQHKNMARLKNILVWIPLLSVLFLFAVAPFGAAVHAGHDCGGGDCAVCLQLHGLFDVLKRLTGSTWALSIVPACCWAGLTAACLRKLAFSPLTATLVGCKTRLNH
jgi:hypothetical protein